MPALTPDTTRTSTEPLADLTEDLLKDTAPVRAPALAEPLLDEHMDLAAHFADSTRALARAEQEKCVPGDRREQCGNAQSSKSVCAKCP
ncbi:hypothetical protein [Streptomyces sp. NPDC046860]|uniref:hypothetical protein n=1 Tax=Streptomyces sp. NPDC046860 TaxID=3154495 RepID=UPI0033C34683